MTEQRFANVWEAIENTPQEVASMQMRSTLMMHLAEVVCQQGMVQADAAILFGVTMPQVADLMRGRINQFSAEALMRMVVATESGYLHPGGS